MVTPATLRFIQDASGEIRLKLSNARFAMPPRTPLQRGVLAAARSATLSDAKISEKPKCIRSGHGSVPRAVSYTTNAKRKIKNACAAIKHLFGRKVLFLTVTLPGSTEQALLTLARYSATFVDTLRHWLAYQAPGSLWVYKWEWQKRGALHLHAALGCADRAALDRIRRCFKRHVYKLFVALSDRAGEDIFSRDDGHSWKDSFATLRIEAKFVRKCVKRYMAKYVGKEPGEAIGYYPSRWWGASLRLKEVARSLGRQCTRQAGSILELSACLQSVLVRLAQFSPKVLHYGNPIYHDDETWIVWIEDKLVDKAAAAAILFMENVLVAAPPNCGKALCPEWW